MHVLRGTAAHNYMQLVYLEDLTTAGGLCGKDHDAVSSPLYSRLSNTAALSRSQTEIKPHQI